MMYGVILFAFALYVHRLADGASFSADDWTIITRSMHSVPEIVRLTNGTPVQALWLHVWAGAAGLGYGEYAMYFTSAFTGVLAVAVAYRLGGALFNRRVGLLCAFLLASSAYHVYWSRSVRYYSWMVLLSSLSFLSLYRALTTNSVRAWAGYGLFRSLSLYVHLSVLLIWAAEAFLVLAVLSYPMLQRLLKYSPKRQAGLAQIGQDRSNWLRSGRVWGALTSSKILRSAVTMALILLMFAPRGYLIVRNMHLGTSTLGVSVVSDEAAAPSELPNRLHVDWRSPFIVLRLFDAWVFPLHTMMMLGFLGGLFFCLLRRQSAQVVLVLAVIIAPFVVAAILDYRKPINSRYVISLLPLYYLMVGRGIVGFSRGIAKIPGLPVPYRTPLLWAFPAIFAVVYLGLSAPRIALTRRNVRANWRGVGEFLAQRAQPGEMVVIDELPQHVSVMQHYLPDFNVVLRDPNVPLEAYVNEQNGFWLVSIGELSYEPAEDGLSDLKYVELIFADAWHPDMDQTTDLRPALSWDLNVAYFERDMASPEQALALYEAWVPEADAYHLRHHLTWARAYQRLDRLDLAVYEYTLALNEGHVNDLLASRILDARGTTRYDLGQEDRAIADWQQAIARADWRWETYNHLVHAYLHLDQADAAETMAKTAIAANPQDAWPYLLLGDVYRITGMDERAVSEYQRAIAIQPSSQAAYWHLGRVYAGKQESKLILLYDPAMERNPSAAWPHLQLGQLYQDLGRVTDAVVQYQQAVELEPEYAPSVSRFLSEARWDLADAIGLAHAYSTQGDLLWWPGNSWVRPRPFEQEVVAGRSTLPVEGRVRPSQVFLHPFSDQDSTYVAFDLQDSPFAYLRVGYGLADEVAGLTNGVGYTIEVKPQGAGEYQRLFTEDVTQSAWREQMVPLTRYWGEDLVFRLAVDALGDYAYDWLQTTVELVPPSRPAWDMSAHIAEAEIVSASPSVTWQGDGFYTAEGGRLMGRSELPVDGDTLPGQVHLHPYSSEMDSTVVFSLTDQPYHTLKTSYALADEALLNSNGVDYAVSVSVDGGQAYTKLVSTTVTTNVWRSTVVDLPASEDLVVRMRSSARLDATYDWLQVSLVLLPFGDGPEAEQPMIESERARQNQPLGYREADTDDR